MIDLKQFEGHTPGPWRRNGKTLVYDSVYGIRIAETRSATIDEVANAKLIAAAPDLLAEVERLRKQVEIARTCLVRIAPPNGKEPESFAPMISRNALAAIDAAGRE